MGYNRYLDSPVDLLVINSLLFKINESENQSMDFQFNEFTFIYISQKQCKLIQINFIDFIFNAFSQSKNYDIFSFSEKEIQ